MLEDLTSFWNGEFPDFVPEAHNLKREYKARWVRFHSLPKSKRYPENEGEYLEVLRRHNLVLQALCGNDSKVFVVLPEYSEERKPSPQLALLLELFSASEYWRTLVRHDDDDDYEFYWHLHVAEIDFSGGELNRLFRMVASDEVGNVMIICPSKRVVFHPYDGGADIVLASAKERDRLKEQHREWLSSHPDGY